LRSLATPLILEKVQLAKIIAYYMDTPNILFPYLFDLHRLPIAAMSVVAVACGGMLFGPVGGDANPLIWRVFNGLFGGLGAKMDKSGRKRGDLIMRGFFLSVLVFIGAYFVGEVVSIIAVRLNVWHLTDILLLSLFLTAGAGWRALLKLQSVLKNDKMSEGAYYALATTTRTNLTQVDDFTITRKGIAMAVQGLDGIWWPDFQL
jgi:adenosylcobinamide-phosphate synthase